MYFFLLEYVFHRMVVKCLHGYLCGEQTRLLAILYKWNNPVSCLRQKVVKNKQAYRLS